MALSLGKWSIGKSKNSVNNDLEKARGDAVNQLLDEQKRLRGESHSESALADIDAHGVGQVKVYYRYFNLLGDDNCVMVGNVRDDAELADKIDEVIELVRSGELDDALKEALKKETRDENQQNMLNHKNVTGR